MAIPKLKSEARVIQIKLPFLIPTEKEVSEYIQTKMGWPKSFTDHYAERFWNFYQQKNWMIGKSPMKDWKAAFNCNWKVISSPKDELLLTTALRKQVNQTTKNDLKIDRNIEYANEMLLSYFKHPTWEHNFQYLYDYLKENRPFKLTPEEVQICRRMGPERGKAQAIKFLFDQMIKDGSKF